MKITRFSLPEMKFDMSFDLAKLKIAGIFTSILISEGDLKVVVISTWFILLCRNYVQSLILSKFISLYFLFMENKNLGAVLIILIFRVLFNICFFIYIVCFYCCFIF